MEQFFNFLTSKHTEQGQPWVFSWLYRLPDLLVKLIQPTTVQSLERLQLVNISCRIDQVFMDMGHSRFSNIELAEISGPTRFLVLSGDLTDGKEHLLTTQITYFVRGQKKYFQTKIEREKSGQSQPLDNLTDVQIKNFYKLLGCDNDFFSNKEISLLNGQPALAVPSEVAAALLIFHVLQETKPAYRFFEVSLDFIDTIRIDQTLGMSQQLVGDTLHTWLLADEEVKIYGRFMQCSLPKHSAQSLP